jgi:hypothetical protein
VVEAALSFAGCGGTSGVEVELTDIEGSSVGGSSRIVDGEEGTDCRVLALAARLIGAASSD